MSEKEKGSKQNDLLKQWLNRKKGAAKPKGIIKQKTGEAAVLSHGQERLWLLQQLSPQTPLYNYAHLYRFSGITQVDILLDSFQEVVARHHILKTAFLENNGEVRQQYQEGRQLELSRMDYSQWTQEEANKAIDQLIVHEGQKTFDLHKDSLIRLFAITLPNDQLTILLVMHHIIGDRESLAILNKEWFTLYRNKLNGQPSSLSDLSVQYVDFAHWQRQKTHKKEDLDYWLTQLEGELPILQLPFDHKRPQQSKWTGQQLAKSFSPSLYQALLQLAKKYNTTSFVIGLAAFKILLQRYSNQNDILVGVPVSNRDRVELEALIGFFNETLVMRSKVEPIMNFSSVLQQLKQTTLNAFARKSVPFETLVSQLKPERQGSINPIFQAMFVFNGQQGQQDLPAGVSLEEEMIDLGVSKFDLTLFWTDHGDHFSANFEYATELFEADTITSMLDHLEVLLEAIVDQPLSQIASLPILTRQESHKIVRNWNLSGAPEPIAKTIVELFDKQLEQNPDHIAVAFQQDCLSYQELNQKATIIANYLTKENARTGQLIGLYCKPGLDMIIGLLGILKAGAGYLPLDPDYPSERIEYMLKDAQVEITLAQDQLKKDLPKVLSRVLGIREIINIVGPDDNMALPKIDPNGLAYMIYTSGSTGKPKGVPITHRNLLYSTSARFHFYEQNPSAFLLLSSFSFDSSVAGIFWTLASGGKLVLTPKRSEQDINNLARIIKDEQVTHSLMLPSLYQVLLEYAPTESLSSLSTIMVAGEACFPSLVQLHYKTLPQTSLYNEYGPTEGTVWSTAHRITLDDAEEVVPIGKPIPYMQNYILGAENSLLPIGVAGELYIGGAGIAEGYWNRPELTQKRFLPNPFGEGQLYKTGDLARYRKDGTIEFLGRADEQIKIRGHRVELDEIKNYLLQWTLVEDAVMLVQKDNHISSIIAYLKAEEKIDLAEIKRWLHTQVPAYMVPAAFVILEDFPRLPNGKVDRKKLPTPELDTITSGSGRLPETEMEKQLAEIWQSVLKREKISTLDNFFEIGGDSIRSIQVISKAQQQGINLTPNHLFEYQNIADLARFLSNSDVDDEQWSSVATINKSGKKTPLFCIHSGAAHVFFYRNLAKYLGEDQPVFALQPKGLDGKLPHHNSIEEMAEFYIKEIKRIKPEGPYSLLGTCFSNAVGVEMAHQMSAAGDKIEILVFVDSGPAHLVAANIRGEKKTMQRFSKMLKEQDWKGIYKKIRNRAIRLSRKLRKPFINDQQKNLQDTITNLNQLYKQYNWQPLNRPVLFIRSTEFANRKDKNYQIEQWEHLSGGQLDTHIVEGHHLTLFEEPEVKGLAKVLAKSMEKKTLNV